MIKAKLDNLESVEVYLEGLKYNRPYAWTSIRYHRQVEDHWCFYSTKPRDNGNKLYKVNNIDPIMS